MQTPKKKQVQLLEVSRKKINSASILYIGTSPNNQTPKSSKLKLSQSKISQNLQSSRLSKLSSKSTHIDSKKFHIKLPHGFYNDQKTNHYIQTSKSLSQTAVLYQVKPISITERTKLNSSKLESLVHRRKTEAEKDQSLEVQLQKSNTGKNLFNHKRSQSSMYTKFLPIPKLSLYQRPHRPLSQSVGMNSLTQKKPSAADKFKTHTFEKYNKLVYGSKLKQIETKILNNDINRIASQGMIKRKWYPPFQSANTLRKKFQGKNITSNSKSKQRQQSVVSKSSSTQLKVLNIDRMFRKRQGKLTNIVPFQVPKISQITSLKNVNLINKKKNNGKLHEIIDEFNCLLRLSKLKKARSNSKIIGIKGKNFTKNPTFEQLMGLKLRPKTNLYTNQSEEIPPEVFIEHSATYKAAIRNDFELSKYLISGIQQKNRNFNLQVLTRFYKIFVNKIATVEEKIRFLSFFFIPSKNEHVMKSQLIEKFEIVCKQKSFTLINVNVKTEALTNAEKQSIFLEALTRVMFGDIGQDQKIDRPKLYKILKQNDEAIDLLLKLIGKEEE